MVNTGRFMDAYVQACLFLYGVANPTKAMMLDAGGGVAPAPELWARTGSSAVGT
jgi:hypothetical protein